jgi:hypothetical protein
MLERVPLAGLTVIADKGFAGAEFEGWMADRGAEFLRPDRKDEPLRFGSLGRVRQWIESVFGPARDSSASSATARALPGLCASVGLRLLALAAGLRHNAEIGQPSRCLSAYGHQFGINHLGVKPLALRQALVRYERKGNIVMAERTRARLVEP